MVQRYLHDNMAGNFHDVWKHFSLSEYISKCVEISKNLTYIDTHSGAIFYKNNQMDQLKTGLLNVSDALNKLPSSPYKRVLDYFGARVETDLDSTYLLYPGSLGIASYFFIDKYNKIFGCEINDEVANKCENVMKTLKRAIKTPLEFKCIRSDGFEFALKYVKNAPVSEEGIIFVDPSYFPDEHLDWRSSKEVLEEVLEQLPNWTFILFYCIYTNNLESNKGYYEAMIEYLHQNSNRVKSINLQLQIKELTSDYAKTITGLLIVNPKMDPNVLLSDSFSSELLEIANLLKIQDVEWDPKIRIDRIGV